MSYLEIAKHALADAPKRRISADKREPDRPRGEGYRRCEKSDKSEQRPLSGTASQGTMPGPPPPLTAEEEAKICRWIEQDKGLPVGSIALYPPEALPELVKLWGLNCQPAKRWAKNSMAVFR